VSARTIPTGFISVREQTGEEPTPSTSLGAHSGTHQRHTQRSPERLDPTASDRQRAATPRRDNQQPTDASQLRLSNRLRPTDWSSLCKVVLVEKPPPCWLFSHRSDGCLGQPATDYEVHRVPRPEIQQEL